MALDTDRLVREMKRNNELLQEQPDGTHLVNKTSVYRKNGHMWSVVAISGPSVTRSPLSLSQYMAFYPGEWALL